MNRTSIEWVKNPDGTQGYSFNPITGCLNHTNGRCEGGNFPCYACRLAHGRLRDRYLTNSNVADTTNRLRDPNSSLWDRVATDPFYPRFWQDRMADMVWQQETKPKGIFVCDMGELFGDWLPEQWQKQVFAAMGVNPQHRFYLLTKQPQNLIKWSPFPDNCWVGVTATNDDMAKQAINYLRQIEAKMKYISFEPLLDGLLSDTIECVALEKPVDWVIIGAQTRPTVYPRIEWVREIVEAADKAGVPAFLKDNLRSALRFHSSGIWRQEMPA
ncbi:MAG: phage Gp37/Gp68 family protein [Gammaproteobacteria bacterium]|nr:phage Gp37/Gp68 family protein [Gammaproteobacteria bacterium]